MCSQSRIGSNDPETRTLRQRVNLHFQYLYDTAVQEGLQPSDLMKIDAVVELREDLNSFEIPNYVWKCLAAFVISFISLVIVYLSEWPVDNDTVFKLWMDVGGADPISHQCAVEVFEFMPEMFRPPARSCNFCRNVKSVKKVENISPEQFEELYAYTGRPVVVRDGTKDWTASTQFSYKFLKSIYSKNSTALKNVEENCQFFPYKSNFKDLEEVFDMSDDKALMKDRSSPWYIGW